MRLPFLQVTNEVMDQAAPDLAVLLGWSEGDAFLGLCRLFRWALGRCPTDSPPSANAIVKGASSGRLIANAARWTGDPDIFVAACEDVRPALLEQMEGGSVRIRGLDRYDAAWARSFPDEAKAWKQELRGSCAEVAQELSKFSAEIGHQTKTQIETQTHKEEPTYVGSKSVGEVAALSAIRAPAVVIEGAIPDRREPESVGTPLRKAAEPPEPMGRVAVEPDTPPENWNSVEFFRWAQSVRQDGGLVPEKPPNLAKLAAWWTSCRMTPGISTTAMQEGFYAFGQDAFWETKTPPFPFAGFMSQWEKFTQGHQEVSHEALA